MGVLETANEDAEDATNDQSQALEKSKYLALTKCICWNCRFVHWEHVLHVSV